MTWSYGGEPDPDYTDIRAADTRLSWLQRTEPIYVWLAHPFTGSPVGVRAEGDHWYNGCVFITISEQEFHNIAVGRGAAAPVWPGLGNVTLGTPVALAADVTIPGPLDGLLIALTTPPSGLSNFTMGGQTWYYRAGQVAFVSDNGDTETWQYITWTNALYCPRTMARAASAILRGLSGIEGTVTPWLTV